MRLGPRELLSVERVRNSVTGKGQDPDACTQDPSPPGDRGFHAQLAVAEG